MEKHIITALCGATMLCGAARAELPSRSEKYLPLALAQTAADAAIKSCVASGYKVAVTIVDAAGERQLLLVGDAAHPGADTISFRKAYSAMRSGGDSGDLPKHFAGMPGGVATVLAIDPQMIILPGGIPIRAGKDVIGGIGVSGAPGGEKDAACAVAGLAAIKDQLN